MKVDNTDYRTIWYDDASNSVKIIDQRVLPFKFEIVEVVSAGYMAKIILEMYVRGAGLIGAAAAWGVYLAVRENSDIDFIIKSAEMLAKTRPTAVNLQAALDIMLPQLTATKQEERLSLAHKLAQQISDNDAESCKTIDEHGYTYIKDVIAKGENKRINILTHCNAG
jgi:methylthioribose-1-phosphate isomerase